MTRIVLITSGKGGAGKTTLVSNLSSALTELGQDVIAMDANLTTPNLSLHLGFQLSPKTLHDVLKGKTSLSAAIYPHPLGFKVLPASMSIDDLRNVDVARLSAVTLGLYGKADYIIMDSAAGLGREAVSTIQAAEEILLITNPDLPSVADVLKTAKIAEKNDKRILGVVVNRVKRKWHELMKSEIEEISGYPVLVEIPEDKNVPKSIAVKLPVVEYDPLSPASIEIRRLAHMLVGKEFKYKKPFSFRILDRLVGWVVG